MKSLHQRKLLSNKGKPEKEPLFMFLRIIIITCVETLYTDGNETCEQALHSVFLVKIHKSIL